MELDFDDHAAPAAKAGARFKPKGRPQPKKKQVSTDDVAKEKLSTQMASISETSVPDSETINQFTSETISKENVDVLSGGVNLCMEPSVLRACTNIEAVPAFPDDPITQDSTTFGDFVTPETDEVIDAQNQRMQTEEEDCHLDMETLDIVQEEGITNTYEQHTGKFQPKPRVLDPVIEELESHDSIDTGYFTTLTNESEFTVNAESRNDFNSNTTFYGDFQEKVLNFPQVPTETVPEMDVRNASGEWEHEEQVISPSTVEEKGSGRESKKEKSKRATARKRKTTTEEGGADKSSENQEKKKFKHTSRRQKKRTLEKELLETPDDEIRFLPIRDMLRLVEYKEWMEKKEAKGATVEPPTQESNTNASQDQHYSQGFDAEDEFGLEESENQESMEVKPEPPVNYQTYMNKTSRTRWSKQDTELFYEGIREFGSNLSMVQQLFPDKTREQIKLKFKSEERRYPLKLNDALSSRSKHLTHFKNVIKKLQQEAAAAREEEGEEQEQGEGEAGAETTTNVPENEESTKFEETERAVDGVAKVKESNGGDECDNEEDDDDFWNSYKSEM